MTSEEKVRHVYPDAFACSLSSGRFTAWEIWCGDFGCIAGATYRESWAWADAWRRIQAERKGER